MNLRGNETLRERLAAEYVLGTLRGRARRRFEGLLHDDAALRRTVREWNGHLGAMAEFVPPVQPRPQVWRALEARLGWQAAAPRWQFWRRGSLAWWRGVALASSALAALLLVAVLQAPPDAPVVTDIASLADEQARPALVVTADRERARMTVKVVASVPLTARQALQLWAVPRQGKPRSLGVLGAGRELSLPLPAHAIGEEVAVLAVSLEPAGGSPNPDGPSGPILYKGSWVRLM
ncbi:anti-sigma factor [Massilia sp. GCM10023247]|uniref:anti-sigma factor n=1 Tax=Massilia sp. GCM10023247 TaxID=3252643 RepID=UPI00360930F4